MRKLAPRASWTALAPESWRSDLLRIVLRVVLVLGAVVCVPSVVVALRVGMLGVAVMDTVAMLLVIALVMLDRLNPRVRAALVCLMMYAVGAGLLISVGAISQIYLFGFSLLTTLLLGSGWGLLTVALNAVTMLSIGWVGLAAPEMVVPRWSGSLASWAVVTSNFVFVNLALVLALGAVVKALERALGRAVAAHQALELEQRRLVDLNVLLRVALQTARMGGWQVDRSAKAVRWSDEVCDLHEVAAGTAPTLDDALAYYLPDSAALVRASVERCFADGTPFDIEAEITTGKGNRRWLRNIGSARRDPAGVITHLEGSSQDISAEKQAATKQEKLELQLQHAQKMEAVGRLAGGVAHDFNNLLGVILGHAHLTHDSLDPKDERREDLAQIIDAGMRSADLTKQLLAFARLQPIAPKQLDLNDSIENLLKMLRRLIGEDVELVWRPGAGLHQVVMDSSQLDQILANLAVNARDAIGGVGKVVIETCNVSLDQDACDASSGAIPGDFVRITVSDTGSGMDAATQRRLFEPFFTTKGVGKGTGLGLATVYGIVKQNGGFITVYSEVGHGSAFQIHLPQAIADAALTEVAAEITLAATGTETVLLVEDEEALLLLSRRLLERLGYTVLAATGPQQALTLAEQHGKIDLLVTDVIMPQMSGREVWEALRKQRPALRCLFVSGYTADIISSRGVLDAGVHFLQKPFSHQDLGRMVREVLAA